MLTLTPCYKLPGSAVDQCYRPTPRPGGFKQLINELFENDLEDFIEFFKTVTGGLSPWGAQRGWAKRLISGENTVLVAPTGIGKSTLLIVYALYASSKGKKVLYLAPTRTLAKQIYLKLLDYASRAGVPGDSILFYDSGTSKKKRELVLTSVKRGEYRVLVATSSFLAKRHELFRETRPQLVIADDVDSLMRSEKSVRKLLHVIGYGDDIIELVKKKLNLLWKLLNTKSNNREDLYQPIVKEYVELDSEIEARIAQSTRSQVVMASATGRMKGLMGKVLKEILRVDASGITIYGRDVTDAYLLVSNSSEYARIAEIISALGPGGIIYVSPRHPLKKFFSDLLAKILEDLSGMRVGEATPRNLEKMARGELDLLVGSASYYGSSVRGIDLPEKIKYVIFLGTPLFEITLENYLSSVNGMLRVALWLAEHLQDEESKNTLAKLRRLSYFTTPGEARLIKLVLQGKIPSDAVANNEKLSSKLAEYMEIHTRLLNQAKTILSTRRVVELGIITLYADDRGYWVLIPDLMTYIQASGRASRLLGGKMTHGLSIIVEYSDLVNLVKGLEAKMRTLSKETAFRDFSDVDLNVEKREIAESRLGNSSGTLPYRSILVVVESPTKAKTIARFFGKPVSRRIGDVNIYEIPVKIGDEVLHLNIAATRGHIYDLTTNEEYGIYGVLVDSNEYIPVYETIKKCRVCGTQFTTGDACPKCGSTIFADSKSVIVALAKVASEVDEVYLATDPDIEGEKIAFDVYTALSEYNTNIKRIELHEITLQEFLKALSNPREINWRLVEAEIYRRILDRWVGFGLSKVLYEEYGQRFLGAGRVQTPVLGLIIERYEEHRRSACKRILIRLRKPVNMTVSFLADKNDPVVKLAKETKVVKLVKKAERLVELHPKPPYTTDEYLLDASTAGIPSNIAMRMAQELFESGLITYHRTDSHYVSSAGISIAIKYLENRGLGGLANPSHWGSPGTHEAIRPVYPYDSSDLLKAAAEGLIQVSIPLTGLHLKLYDMIFKRFISSQMKKAVLKEVVFQVYLGNRYLGDYKVYTRVVENGFTEVAGERLVAELDGVNELVEDDAEIEVLNSSKTPLYTEGDVVALMKDLGIGRPSTYSKILASLRRHGYIISSKKKLKLVPTKRGITVYRLLSERYPELVSVELTREMEEIIDKIASGHTTGVESLYQLRKRLEERALPIAPKAFLSPKTYASA